MSMAVRLLEWLRLQLELPLLQLRHPMNPAGSWSAAWVE